MEVTQVKTLLSWSIVVIVMAVSSFAQDTTPPLIHDCPTNDLYLISNKPFVYANYSAPGYTDESPVTVTAMHDNPPNYDPSRGLQLGQSRTLNFLYIDDPGNWAVCSFIVRAVRQHGPQSCNNGLCQNGGTCTSTTDVITSQPCKCRVGFYGPNCGLVDQTPPLVMNCPTQHFVGFAPEDGSFSNNQRVTWGEPTATDNNYDITVNKSHSPMSIFSPGLTNVVYNFTDIAGNVATCTFPVQILVGSWTLHDGEKPVIHHCPAGNVIIPLEPGVSETVVGWTQPWAVDNSGKITRMTTNYDSMSIFKVGERKNILYVFADDQGNEAICSFDIILIPDNRPQGVEVESDIEIQDCPANTVIANIPPNENHVMVMWTEPRGISKSGRQLEVRSEQTNSPMDSLPVGQTNITYTFTGYDGVKEECIFTIVISQGIDNPPAPVIADPGQEPVIAECPTNIRATLPEGTTQAKVEWKEPTAHSPVNKPMRMTKSNEPGSMFATKQLYQVQYTFTDSDGLYSTCRFDVFLNLGPVEPRPPPNDNTPPRVYDCPFGVEAITPEASIDANVIWVEPYATDNSGITPNVTRSHRPKDKFSIGTHRVTYTFTDLSNNVATCSFVISIEVDIEPPSINNCLKSFAVQLKINQDHAKVYWPEPTATDNSKREPTVWQNFHPGALLPIGVSTITYSFIDTSNNIAVCSFEITVYEATCEYLGVTYGSYQTKTINACIQCACFTGIWYCRPLCDDRCPLVYPEDISASCSIGGTSSHSPMPVGPRIPCSKDSDCGSIFGGGAICCAHSCDGNTYCMNPESPCVADGYTFDHGTTFRSSDGRCRGYTECECVHGEWICDDINEDGCMYKDKSYGYGDRIPAEDNCNTCTCTKEHCWMCTEKTCRCTFEEREYTLGESRTSENGCRTCTCVDVPTGVDADWVCSENQCESRPGTCPPVDGYVTYGDSTCVEECNNDYQCGGNQKCCSNGCGYTCVNAIPDARPGACPAIDGVGTCVEECEYDDQCRGNRICCFNGCGHTCVNAFPDVRKKRSTKHIKDLFMKKSNIIS